MSTWAKGFVVGAGAMFVVAVLIGGTQFDAFVRITGSGQALLDTRVDEPAVGRIVNIPVGSLGDASVGKRTWLVATSYAFTLRLRPEVAPSPGRALSGLQVSVRLPGRVVSTNATRVTAGTAAWDVLPPDALHLRTLAVHWVRVIILVVLLAAGIGVRRS